tara:strand:+ start:2420 stop:2959 length:540 start_codon:yes stop_codon:yes gene_type:complete
LKGYNLSTELKNDVQDLSLLHSQDRKIVDTMPSIVQFFPNHSRWWQNASFALPLIIAVISTCLGFLIQIDELIGFGIFLAVVTLIMFPVVLMTWRNTATLIVISSDRISAFHRGKLMKEISWGHLDRVERVEYLGNTRHKVVAKNEDFLSIENEIEHSEDLIELLFLLSKIPRRSSDTI